MVYYENNFLPKKAVGLGEKYGYSKLTPFPSLWTIFTNDYHNSERKMKNKIESTFLFLLEMNDIYLYNHELIEQRFPSISLENYLFKNYLIKIDNI